MFSNNCAAIQNACHLSSFLKWFGFWVLRGLENPPSFWFFNTDTTFLLKASVTVREVEDIPDRQVEVNFKLQKVGEFPLKSAFDDYLSRGSNVEKPQDQINALNIIISKLKQGPIF